MGVIKLFDIRVLLNQFIAVNVIIFHSLSQTKKIYREGDHRMHYRMRSIDLIPE